MKKLVAFLLVLALTLTSMASCFAAEPVTLRVMIAIRDMDTLSDPSEMPALIALEERTGVKIDWEVVKASDFNTKMNLAFLIPEEYPDIIITVQNTFDVEEYGVTQGLVIPLPDELTSQHMPNYTERLAGEMNDPRAALYASDGQIYTIAAQVSQDYNTDQHFFLNKKWMDNVGITEMPATVRRRKSGRAPCEAEKICCSSRQQDIHYRSCSDVCSLCWYFLLLFDLLPIGKAEA